MAGIPNFQVDRNKSTRGMNIFKIGRSHKKKETRSEKLMNGVNIWASWYRFRMDVFIKDYFGIQLKLFQIILIYAMQNNNFFMYLASRGQGKSFLSALYAAARCVLYPGTIVVKQIATLIVKWCNYRKEERKFDEGCKMLISSGLVSQVCVTHRS